MDMDIENRPANRDECPEPDDRGVRVCPWVGCRYHLALDQEGSEVTLWGDETPSELDHDRVLGLLDTIPMHCALDAAGSAKTYAVIRKVLGRPKPRIRDDVERAVMSVRKRWTAESIADELIANGLIEADYTELVQAIMDSDTPQMSDWPSVLENMDCVDELFGTDEMIVSTVSTAFSDLYTAIMSDPGNNA